MNSKTWTRIIALALYAALALPLQLAAQETAKPHHPHQYHHYQLVDVGTFGGPSSWLWAPPGLFRPGVLNNQGTLAGSADTSALDPYCVYVADCYAINGFQWRNGATTNLGVLPGGIGSEVNWISANGLMAGLSDNGQPDPLNPAFPQLHAVLWDHGQVTDLGTLPEGGYSSGSWAATVNNHGEVAGQAYNTIPDSNSMFGYGYQSRAFLWDKQTGMRDLGTLSGGTDAMAGLINERGQVVGWSFNSSNPNLDNLCLGLALTTGSFIWDKKNGMRDLGGLGGTSCTLAHDLNSRGQVVGGSDVPGEFQHPFVWDAATGMTDLGTPDGGYGVAGAINEHGDVTGLGSNGGALDAILWQKSGGKWRMIDLGTFAGCAQGTSVNVSGQVVGSDMCAGSDGLAFLSETGGPMVDLNTLVLPGSGLQLSEAHQINDRGEIAVGALDVNGNNHSVLMIPCDENHPGVEVCDYSLVTAHTARQNAASRYVPNTMLHSFRSRLSHRFSARGLPSQSR
jgi:probable HAF family extracellular repeat protein